MGRWGRPRHKRRPGGRLRELARGGPTRPWAPQSFGRGVESLSFAAAPEIVERFLGDTSARFAAGLVEVRPSTPERTTRVNRAPTAPVNTRGKVYFCRPRNSRRGLLFFFSRFSANVVLGRRKRLTYHGVVARSPPIPHRVLVGAVAIQAMPSRPRTARKRFVRTIVKSRPCGSFRRAWTGRLGRWRAPPPPPPQCAICPRKAPLAEHKWSQR